MLFSMSKKMPHWIELMFLLAARCAAIQGHREKCETKTVLGRRFVVEPARVDPIITGMSFARCRGEDGAGRGRVDGWDGDLLGEGGDDPLSATCRPK